MGELVASLPKLSSYTEMRVCPQVLIRLFISACKGKPIADSLEAFRLLDSSEGSIHNDDHGNYEEIEDAGTASKPLILSIFQIFPNLEHLTMNQYPIVLPDIETAQAMSRLTRLQTLDLRGNHMFSHINTERIDEWLQQCLPLFPTSLKMIDFCEWLPDSDFRDDYHNRADRFIRLGRRIQAEIKVNIPETHSVDCSPYTTDVMLNLDYESYNDEDSDDEYTNNFNRERMLDLDGYSSDNYSDP
jgi:hypothetical protein